MSLFSNGSIMNNICFCFLNSFSHIAALTSEFKNYFHIFSYNSMFLYSKFKCLFLFTTAVKFF